MGAVVRLLGETGARRDPVSEDQRDCCFESESPRSSSGEIQGSGSGAEQVSRADCGGLYCDVVLVSKIAATSIPFSGVLLVNLQKNGRTSTL